jgi:hypothetical protein
MNGLRRIIFCLLILPVPAFALELSGVELGLTVHPEYNRSMYFSWDAGVFGLLELNRSFVFEGGLALGQIWDIMDIDAHVSGEFAFPFLRDYVPMNVKLAYIYNGMPDYETHIHTLLPLFSINWRWLGGSLGQTLRFTRFAGNPALFEPILAYRVYVNFYHTEESEVGISLANFDDYAANNLGAYFYVFYNRVRLNPLVSLSNELRIDISGTSAYPTSIYGMSYRGGVIFTW